MFHVPFQSIEKIKLYLEQFEAILDYVQRIFYLLIINEYFTINYTY